LAEAPTSVGRRGAAVIPFPGTDRGPATRKAELIKLLFVCRTHAVLSPMAEGLAEAAYERLDISVQSAGLSPAAVDRRAVAAMAELGIDISQACTTAVRDLDLGSFDIVVSLGVHKLGLHPRQMAVAWNIPEFTRVTEATAWPRLRQVRDAISVRVSALGAILTATNRA
jgi:arsenate reductase